MCTLVALLAGGACSGDGAACWAAECKLDRLEFQRGGLTAMKPSKYPCTIFDNTIITEAKMQALICVAISREIHR